MTDEQHEALRRHNCTKEDRRPLTDGRGIFCNYVCDLCEEVKRSQYRPEILDRWYSEADVDEQIEPDDDIY
jgi:hypothetical protein